jgi:carbonyl reductase 1
MARTAIVTGANQGLGLALVRRLCQVLEPGSTVYLTARDRGRGAEAVESLRAQGLEPRLHLLDVGDDASVSDFAAHMAAEHEGVDILVSNAAHRIAREVSYAEQVADFVNVNNHGTHRILQAFGPLLNDGARLVVVASSFGTLRELPAHLHRHFDVERMDLGELEAFMDEYVELVRSGAAARDGWPEWINIPSKVGQVAAMKIFERSLAQEAVRRDIVVNAACPGLVDTGASRPWFSDMSQAASPDAAAEDVAWLATLTPGTRDPHGELVQFRQVLPWL